MTRVQVEQLSGQMKQAAKRLHTRLQGMTDDEYLWEPVAGCWSVRRREMAASPGPMGGGEWVFDSGDELLSPGPFTSIAWRMMHLADVLMCYHTALRGGEVSDDLVEVTPSAADGVALLESAASAFVEALEQEDDESLQRPVQVPWWPISAARWQVVANVATEAIHHGAEIAVLRDLYARRDELGQ